MHSSNVLLAVDGSEAARHACRLVAAYAGDRHRIQLTLLNVQRPPVRLSADGFVHQATLEAALRDAAERELAAARALLPDGWHEVAGLTRVGSPAATILDIARESEADVLVMGSGRHGVLGGYAVGSVALRVAPAAECPVVLVAPGARIPSDLGVRARVAAPVDGSAEALQAVRRLAGCDGLLGRLHVDLVHFRPGLTLAAAMLPPHDDVLQDWSGRESDAALDAPTQVLAAAGVSHEVHRMTGEPDTAVAEFARRQGAGLIAMGTRGVGTMHHLLLGSVALRTALVSDVPVVLMR